MVNTNHLKNKQIYLICPVRNCSKEELTAIEKYVEKLESNGASVHFPPRDVCQDDDGCGMNICESHRKAMLNCDEVHVWWDVNSKGSHFDLGMAYMLQVFKPIKFVMSMPCEKTEHKSYTNVLLKLTGENI